MRVTIAIIERKNIKKAKVDVDLIIDLTTAVLKLGATKQLLVLMDERFDATVFETVLTLAEQPKNWARLCKDGEGIFKAAGHSDWIVIGPAAEKI